MTTADAPEASFPRQLHTATVPSSRRLVSQQLQLYTQQKKHFWDANPSDQYLLHYLSFERSICPVYEAHTGLSVLPRARGHRPVLPVVTRLIHGNTPSHRRAEPHYALSAGCQ
ncbi:hypothetical protein OH76DRAFT_1039341 [Lentinus brumalis]|uniref:Uncharacterized protein n=1 Tax=Lentinus brumalis TaxID=2498619 RepID=A0A371CWV9_9APHY|nr:hypothetical protein OH76DRAFT_1039341 [Polyporus brumalis]